ncbi:trypsin-like peptidase domain-containing protein [Streptomyces boninensis]|uniref:VMAP-C domain-containing protein n=1 Tax=Streptomyces boninensis TaxID=2039455 RepID=UPI003B21ECFC
MPDLESLCRSTTVALGPAGGGVVWGSGFCVAPGWVLTCAHVLEAVREDAIFAVSCDAWSAAGRLAYTTSTGDPGDPAGDLALVRLLDDVENDCAWLCDRVDPSVGDITAYGRPPSPAGRSEWWGRIYQYGGPEGDHAYALIRGEDVRPGASGGPVADPVRGAVVGVVQARRDLGRDGGLAIGLGALAGTRWRRVWAGGGELLGAESPYAELLRAHDRWHRDHPAWREVQAAAAGRPGPGDGTEWTAEDRFATLGLLAELPPPDSPGLVGRLVDEAFGESRQYAGPASWRDGYGRLHDAQDADGVAFLRYLVYLAMAAHVAVAAHPVADEVPPAAEAALRWAGDRALRAGPSMRKLITEVRLPADLTGAGRTEDHRPVVTVEVQPAAWGNGRLRWKIRTDDRRGGIGIPARDRSPEGVTPAGLREALLPPLAAACARLDIGGYRARVEFVLPTDHFDLAAHRWAVPGSALALGAERQVVVRAAGGGARRDDHQAPGNGGLTALALRRPMAAADLTGQRGGTVPVSCRPAARGEGRKIIDGVLSAGYGIALWQTAGEHGSECHEHCGPMFEAVDVLLGTGRAQDLPERLRDTRHRHGKQQSIAHSLKGVALLYEDPARPPVRRTVRSP